MGTLSYQITDVPQLILAGAPLIPNTVAANLGYTLVNNDEVNQLWISPNQVFTPSDPTAVPVAPLGSVPIDPTANTYAVTESGVTVQAFLFAGGGTWAPSPAQVAEQISALGLATADNQDVQVTVANDTITVLGTPAQTEDVVDTLVTNLGVGGVPLLAGLVNLLDENEYLAGAGSVTWYADITKPGYFAGISAQMDNVGSTVPIFHVIVTWWDSSAMDVAIAVEEWGIPAAYDSFDDSYVTARGICKGGYVSIEVDNLDPTYGGTFTLGFYETSLTPPRDDWRSTVLIMSDDSYASLPSEPSELLLAEWNDVTLAADTAYWYLLPLYAGAVQLYVSLTVAETVEIEFFHYDWVGDKQVPIFVESIDDALPHNYSLAFGRMPVMVKVYNTSGTATAINGSIMAVETVL